tara:strand:+ start:1472 stop:3028 length:1557 start_codon:yes stop_codon:yes gene_type:complete
MRVAPKSRAVSDSTLKLVSNERGFDLSQLPDEVLNSICESDDVFFSSLGSKSPAIGFIYERDDAIKWRTISEKNFTATGSARSLFPASQSVDRGDTIYLTEGEYDALAFVRAGYTAYSTPSGANLPATGSTPEYLKGILDDLSSGKINVVIAVDSDEKGNRFRESLISILGRTNISYIDWSQFDCKDANECIRTHGIGGIERACQSAREVLFEGIMTASSVASNIDAIRTGGFKQGAKVGIDSLDKLMTICSDQISVVTGVPGSGKSELIDAIMVSLAQRENWRFAIFSAENPIDIHVGKLAEKFIGAPIFEGENRMSELDMNRASEWLDDHFFFLDPASDNSLKSILDRASVLIKHKNVNGLLIDPFNYTDVSLDTDSISNMLTELHAFATQNHIHIWIVAHPQKMYRMEGGRMPTPLGMDISGSAAWFAKADFGITVERGEENETKVIVWKCRFKWLGDTGTAYLNYDHVSGRYSDGQTADQIIDALEWEEPQDDKEELSGEEFDLRNQEPFTFDA